MSDQAFFAPQHGTVVDNADPDGLHRVRIRVPGLIEKTWWAFPLTAGGGSAQRGGHIAPAIGADVVVWFINGDPEFPVYSCAWWGIPAAGSEMPDTAKEVGAQAHLVQSMQLFGGRLRFTVDERNDRLILAIEDSVTGDNVTWDMKNAAIRLKVTAALLIKVVGMLNVEALQINLNGRKVLPDSKGI